MPVAQMIGQRLLSAVFHRDVLRCHGSP